MDFLGWIKKYLPETYWAPLEGHTGWEIYEAMASLFNLEGGIINEAIAKMDPMEATAGIYTEINVTLLNTSSTATAALADTLSIRNPGGYRYKIESSTTITAGASSTLLFKALAMNEEYNFLDYRIDPWELVEDGVSDIDILSISSVTLATSGRSPTLDVLAAERMLSRAPGETDTELRYRLTHPEIRMTDTVIEDTLTTNALVGVVVDAFDVLKWNTPFASQGYAGQMNLLKCVRKPWLLIYLKQPAGYNGTGSNTVYDNAIAAFAVAVYSKLLAGVPMILQDDYTKQIDYKEFTS